MDKETLGSLHTKLLKAQFKDQQIDREGSFLNYFRSNLHRYIADPYREDVTSEIICKIDDQGDLDVFERVTYVCRKSALGIQSHVNWLVDKDEYLGVESVKVSIQYPYYHEKRGVQEDLFSGDSETGKEFSIPLDKYKDVDGLIVIANSKYKVSRDSFQYWTMAHPTKNFVITIIYPADRGIQVKPLVINPEFILATRQPGYFKAKYDSWMFPESGLAWKILSHPTPHDEA